jgi:hypothetical protein
MIKISKKITKYNVFIKRDKEGKFLKTILLESGFNIFISICSFVVLAFLNYYIVSFIISLFLGYKYSLLISKSLIFFGYQYLGWTSGNTKQEAKENFIKANNIS